jgi:hypothetical protein
MAAIGIILGLIGAAIGVVIGLVAGLAGMVVGLLAGSLGLLIHVFPIVLIVLGTIWLVKGSKPKSPMGIQPSHAGPASSHNSSTQK